MPEPYPPPVMRLDDAPAEAEQPGVRRRPPPRAAGGRTTARVKRALWHAIGLILFRTGVYRLFFRSRALVVLFHRVDARYGDNPISCTPEKFREFCGFFARYFTTVSLAELVAKLERGEKVGGDLVITFDDGYRDNFVTAAVDLHRHGLPACFFVTTGFVGSDEVPFWDAKLSIRSEWMTWDQVRALRERGFELGAHTVSHVDLGQVSGPPAVREIVESKRRLEAETGAPVHFFAYPFGDRHQLTEENRAAVRRAGFRCCVSAYGGTVGPGDDPFRLQRIPISPWYRSAYQFGFEAIVSALRAGNGAPGA